MSASAPMIAHTHTATMRPFSVGVSRGAGR